MMRRHDFITDRVRLQFIQCGMGMGVIPDSDAGCLQLQQFFRVQLWLRKMPPWARSAAT